MFTPYVSFKTPSIDIRVIHVSFWSTVLEVMQFARDAHMAEGWMIAQEPYLKNENLGVSRLDLRFTKMSDDLKEIV